MAEETYSLRSLRETNLLLLSKLHVAQKTIWKDVKTIKSKSESSGCGRRLESPEIRGHGLNCTPVTMRRRGLSELSAKSLANEFEVAEQRVSTTRESRDKENIPLSGEGKHLNSILRTPQSRRGKQVDVICENSVPSLIHSVVRP